MKKKRIVVMGFMGSMPIAGVIWQHIHYIVGLQHLGHDVYYIEDSARLPYNPETFEVNNEFDYAAGLLTRLSGESVSKIVGRSQHGIPRSRRQNYRCKDSRALSRR
jgi:hypothetical protein